MATSNDGHNSGGSSTESPPRGFGVFLTYISNNKTETAQWFSRMFTVFCAIMYLFPIYGQAVSFGFYQRSIIAHGLTSALRLHQRMPPFRFTTEYLALLLVEDSCHNLFYSLIFANSYPFTMVLTPVFLFALLHSSNFTKKAIMMIDSSLLNPIKALAEKLISKQTDILRFIAMNEILLMPCLIFMAFTGRMSLVIPIIYIRFLTFRYQSRRNPYCKQIFFQMRVRVENYCQRPGTNAAVRTFLTKCIGMISRFAPPETVPQG
ncbi:transmembrane protein 33-like [Apostichopus japonicus]|uniref:transmembrane protein 33-like n=1 Tax=Stichopus japonicus TaxID=307972 RepID=UPI003AB32828